MGVADDDDSAGAPAATVYKSHSANIMETLEKLLEQAEQELADARKTETQNLHNFEMLKQSLEDGIKFADEDMAEAKQGLSKADEKKAAAEGDLDVTSKALKADEDTLADLHHNCMTKAQDFEDTTKSRDEELKAIAEAKRIIKETTGGASKITYGLAQVSLLQVASRTDLAKFEAVR